MSVLARAVLRLQGGYIGPDTWLDKSGNGHDAANNGALAMGYEGLRYLYIPGLSGNYVTTPDAAQYDYSTSLRVEARVRFVDAKGGADDQCLLSQWDIPNDMIFRVIAVSNRIQLYNNGTLIAQSDAGTFLNDVDYWFAAEAIVGAGDGTCAFYSSTTPTNDPAAVTWTQIGSTATGLTIASDSPGAPIELGSRVGGTDDLWAGRYYRARYIADSVVALDVDFTDAQTPFATFVERSNAATVTINRSGTAARSTVVDRKMWLLTTSDYLEVTDHADLDFIASDDFTVMAVARTNTVAAGQDVLVAKKDNLTTSAGYVLSRSTATSEGILADGAADDNDTVATVSVDTLHVFATVRDTAADTIEAFLDGVGSGSATTDSTTVTLANALPLRIGATSGTAASFFEGVITDVVVWREALSAAHVLQAGNELTGGASDFLLLKVP